MRQRLWPWVWCWLAWLGATETAPSQDRTEALTPEGEPLQFIDSPNFFDYPDSDQAKVFAVSQFIGEKPAIFVNSGSSSDIFQHILVAALVLAFLFSLFQFCTHM
ncbi:fertilization-influencing membrane protein [Rhynchocyon petersi]